jgi:hypothetical protein
MRGLALLLRRPAVALAVASILLLTPAVALAAASASPPATHGECSPERDGVSFCIYRSLLPSVGIVSSCRGASRCQVGHYYGNPSSDVAWFTLPPGMVALPEPQVFWLTSTLAQVRFDCGQGCSWSYFYDAIRRRLSEPRRVVLAVDSKRLLMAMVEERMLVVRQVFSGREVARIEREWTPGVWLGDAVTALRFDPDGRLTLTWLRGNDRVPVTERVSVPSVPASPGQRAPR